MKVLIIKNDGLGDLILALPILSNIYKKKNNLEIDLILGEVSLDLKFFLKRFKNIFFLKNLASNFNPKKKISQNDINILSKIKDKEYDICFVMRRNLNYENLKVMQVVNAKKKYICIENISKNKFLSQEFNRISSEWENITQEKQNVNEYNYYKFFLQKIGFTIKKKNFKFRHLKSNNNIVINLSGEKLITTPNNLSILIDLVLNNTKKKITIIGKTFNKSLNKEFGKILNKYKNNKRILNLFSKTNFRESMNFIDRCSIYIGFETGLSHYAVYKKIKSLIILASGGGHKWFPYPKSIRKNETYWMYNTPCSDCDYVGENQCLFEKRICVDNIFKFDLKDNFIDFLNDKNNKINFSSYSHFLSNWRYKSKRSDIYKIDFNQNIKSKRNITSKLKYFFEIIKFIFKNQLFNFLFKKFVSKIF